MSASSQPSTALLRLTLLIFDVALNNTRTARARMHKPSIAVALRRNNSPDAILEIFRRQAQALDNFRQQHERLMACLSPIINILFTFSAALGEGIGLLTSGTIFTGIGILLGVTLSSILIFYGEGFIASYEKLVQLFERIHFFLQRSTATPGSTPARHDRSTRRNMAQVLSVLAHSTRAMKESRTKKFLKRLVGRTDVEDALERGEFNAGGENLEVTHRVDDNVKENMKLNHHIVHKVTAKLITWLGSSGPINQSQCCLWHPAQRHRKLVSRERHIQ
ncbi:hypothetical protein BC826DRAFT_1064383 [Russula brevipes]|nr:hypothetical protein BC826DRAFT_1064383 [Russula brevipes]